MSLAGLPKRRRRKIPKEYPIYWAPLPVSIAGQNASKLKARGITNPLRQNLLQMGLPPQSTPIRLGPFPPQGLVLPDPSPLFEKQFKGGDLRPGLLKAGLINSASIETGGPPQPPTAGPRQPVDRQQSGGVEDELPSQLQRRRRRGRRPPQRDNLQDNPINPERRQPPPTRGRDNRRQRDVEDVINPERPEPVNRRQEDRVDRRDDQVIVDPENPTNKPWKVRVVERNRPQQQELPTQPTIVTPEPDKPWKVRVVERNRPPKQQEVPSLLNLPPVEEARHPGRFDKPRDKSASRQPADEKSKERVPLAEVQQYEQARTKKEESERKAREEKRNRPEQIYADYQLAKKLHDTERGIGPAESQQQQGTSLRDELKAVGEQPLDEQEEMVEEEEEEEEQPKQQQQQQQEKAQKQQESLNNSYELDYSEIPASEIELSDDILNELGVGGKPQSSARNEEPVNYQELYDRANKHNTSGTLTLPTEEYVRSLENPQPEPTPPQEQQQQQPAQQEEQEQHEEEEEDTDLILPDREYIGSYPEINVPQVQTIEEQQEPEYDYVTNEAGVAVGLQQQQPNFVTELSNLQAIQQENHRRREDAAQQDSIARELDAYQREQEIANARQATQARVNQLEQERVSYQQEVERRQKQFERRAEYEKQRERKKANKERIEGLLEQKDRLVREAEKRIENRKRKAINEERQAPSKQENKRAKEQPEGQAEPQIRKKFDTLEQQLKQVSRERDKEKGVKLGKERKKHRSKVEKKLSEQVAADIAKAKEDVERVGHSISDLDRRRESLKRKQSQRQVERQPEKPKGSRLRVTHSTSLVDKPNPTTVTGYSILTQNVPAYKERPAKIAKVDPLVRKRQLINERNAQQGRAEAEARQRAYEVNAPALQRKLEQQEQAAREKVQREKLPKSQVTRRTPEQAQKEKDLWEYHYLRLEEPRQTTLTGKLRKQNQIDALKRRYGKTGKEIRKYPEFAQPEAPQSTKNQKEPVFLREITNPETGEGTGQHVYVTSGGREREGEAESSALEHTFQQRLQEAKQRKKTSEQLEGFKQQQGLHAEFSQKLGTALERQKRKQERRKKQEEEQGKPGSALKKFKESFGGVQKKQKDREKFKNRVREEGEKERSQALKEYRQRTKDNNKRKEKKEKRRNELAQQQAKEKELTFKEFREKLAAKERLKEAKKRKKKGAEPDVKSQASKAQEAFRKKFAKKKLPKHSGEARQHQISSNRPYWNNAFTALTHTALRTTAPSHVDEALVRAVQSRRSKGPVLRLY